MMKVVFNRWIIEKYCKIAAGLATIFSIVIIYVSTEYQKTALFILLVLLLLVYIGVILYANLKKSVNLKIHNTKIIIKQGDLFTQPGSKVIPMNEFFDVDIVNGVIDPGSLHGQYIEMYANKTPEKLYEDIVERLQYKNPKIIDQERTHGGQIKYELGTIYDDKQGYFLLAYSKFDNYNRAYLKKDDVVQCYMNMWNEIDIIRGTKSIVFPVLGAGGIVRFNKEYTPQQLIELILWSFRVSGVQLSKNATLTIVVHESIVEDIDFLKLSYYSD